MDNTLYDYYKQARSYIMMLNYTVSDYGNPILEKCEMRDIGHRSYFYYMDNRIDGEEAIEIHEFVDFGLLIYGESGGSYMIRVYDGKRLIDIINRLIVGNFEDFLGGDHYIVY